MESKIMRHYPFIFENQLDGDEVARIEKIFCIICGKRTTIEKFSENRRESGVCNNCGSWNRQRLMALFILDHLKSKYGKVFESLSSSLILENLKIFSAEWYGAIHKCLSKFNTYKWSRYSGSVYKSGEVVDGHPHQDLLATSFDTNEFDLVLTADVLEHIPDPYLAHKEIHRILKPGGVHIFTVPSNMNRPLDDKRAVVVDGRVVHLSQPEWHGIESDSNLVYTVFGLEMLSRLSEIGFEANFYEANVPKFGIVGPRAFIFTAKKIA